MLLVEFKTFLHLHLISLQTFLFSDEACSFIITNKHHGEIPFMVQIVNKAEGEAKLVAKKELNCEKRKAYKFDIAAVGCDGLTSEK